MGNVSNWVCQFPISLAVEGASCYQRMADAGLQRTLFCSVIYSPYRLVLPRYPQKAIYSMEEGRYYYQPVLSRYADLPVQPQPSGDFAGRDLMREMVDGAHAAGIEAGVWLSIFANGAIAKQYPSWAVRNMYDSADRLFLCTNNPKVREYSLRIIEEMAERYGVQEIMLDKIPQSCLEQNAFAGRIEPIMRTLGSLCFCPSCIRAAKEAGIDLLQYRERAIALAGQAMNIPQHLINAQADELNGDTEIPLLMLDNPWILDILNFRLETIRTFLAEARARIAAKRKDITLSVAFVPHAKVGHDASSPRAWLAAQSYAAYKNADIDLIHSVVHYDAGTVEYNTRRAMNAVADSKMEICTHIRAYGSTDPTDLPGIAAAVKRGGTDRIGYFCYDLMNEEMLKAVGMATGASTDMIAG
jgi:hypothetical protein